MSRAGDKGLFFLKNTFYQQNHDYYKGLMHYNGSSSKPDGIGGLDFNALLKKYSESNGAQKMNEYLEHLLATGIKVFLPKDTFPGIERDLAEKITWEQLPADAATAPFYKRMLGVR